MNHGLRKQSLKSLISNHQWDNALQMLKNSNLILNLKISTAYIPHSRTPSTLFPKTAGKHLFTLSSWMPPLCSKLNLHSSYETNLQANKEKKHRTWPEERDVGRKQWKAGQVMTGCAPSLLVPMALLSFLREFVTVFSARRIKCGIIGPHFDTDIPFPSRPLQQTTRIQL